MVANGNIPSSDSPAGLGFIRASKPWSDDVLLVEADVIDETDNNSTARHDSVKLADTITEAYRKYRGDRRRLPRIRLHLDRNLSGYGTKDSHGDGQADPTPSYDKVNGN